MQTAGLHTSNKVFEQRGDTMFKTPNCNLKEMRMRLKPLLTSVLVLGLLSTSTLFGKIEDWDTFNGQEVTHEDQRSLPKIIIARPENIKGTAINVYVDGEYLTSLLPGAYTIDSVCPGTHRIRLAYTNVLTHYKEKEKGGQVYRFDSNKQHFFRIVAQANTLQLQMLSPKEAENIEDDYTKKQTHTISRLSKKKCAQRARKNKNTTAKRN
jgi:OOP family OmpA-OmpF porin